jgi:hypothetical protein
VTPATHRPTPTFALQRRKSIVDKHTELRWGYTVASLEGLARKAAYDSHWRFLPPVEKYEIAWSAIAEELYACDEAPSASALLRRGEKAIRQHVDDLGHSHGIYYAGHSSGRIAPGTPMPRFEKYWWSHALPTGSPEDRIVDELALQQIWSRLTKTHQSVLLALAVHGDYQRAADALNKSYKSIVTQIYTARKQFFRLWHQHETAPGVWGRDRRKRSRPRGEDQRSITAATIRKRRARAKARTESNGP